ncbi:MAG: PEP-CTERM sorting domain-containing protein [Planctomycetia bacterium]|nr:PEP-CTERM sorting domain-containing protein [Planctomycetia bacterium]
MKYVLLLAAWVGSVWGAVPSVLAVELTDLSRDYQKYVAGGEDQAIFSGTYGTWTGYASTFDNDPLKVVLTGESYSSEHYQMAANLASDYQADMTHTQDAAWKSAMGNWRVYGSNSIVNTTEPTLVLHAGKTLATGANYAAGGYGMSNADDFCGEISNRTNDTNFTDLATGTWLRINPGHGEPDNPENLVFRWTPDGEAPLDIYFDGFLQSWENLSEGGWIDFSIVVDGATLATFNQLTFEDAAQLATGAYRLDFDGFAQVSEYIDFVVGNNGDFYSDVSAFGLKLYAINANQVPEPATWLLLVLGLGGYGWMRKRNQETGGVK